MSEQTFTCVLRHSSKIHVYRHAIIYNSGAWSLYINYERLFVVTRISRLCAKHLRGHILSLKRRQPFLWDLPAPCPKLAYYLCLASLGLFPHFNCSIPAVTLDTFSFSSVVAKYLVLPEQDPRQGAIPRQHGTTTDCMVRLRRQKAKTAVTLGQNLAVFGSAIALLFGQTLGRLQS